MEAGLAGDFGREAGGDDCGAEREGQRAVHLRRKSKQPVQASFPTTQTRLPIGSTAQLRISAGAPLSSLAGPPRI
jgi:hypothetical protein